MSGYQHKWQGGQPIDLPKGKIVCVGKNYADHIKEMNSATPDQAVLFLKPTTALCSATQAIKVSHLSHLGALHHELEIALLIGEELNRYSKTHTQAICGLGLGIDLTLRDLQANLKKQMLPWERAKAFDGSCAVSPFIKFDEAFDLEDLSLDLVLNGKTQQQGNSSQMLYPIQNLLKEISQVFTLLPGDIVLTGTPAGVGPLHAGDKLSGRLNNQILIDNTNVI